MESGIKNDQDKTRVELLSPKWLLGVGRVLTFGAKKYAAHNWRNGLERSRLLGAALRHILAYMDGEDMDQESGLSHLHHASCCLMFASELHETRPDLDDRYKKESNPKDDFHFQHDKSKDEYTALKAKFDLLKLENDCS